MELYLRLVPRSPKRAPSLGRCPGLAGRVEKSAGRVRRPEPHRAAGAGTAGAPHPAPSAPPSPSRAALSAPPASSPPGVTRCQDPAPSRAQTPASRDRMGSRVTHAHRRGGRRGVFSTKETRPPWDRSLPGERVTMGAKGGGARPQGRARRLRGGPSVPHRGAGSFPGEFCFPKEGAWHPCFQRHLMVCKEIQKSQENMTRVCLGVHN